MFGQRLASSTNGKADDEEINFNAMGADIYYIAIKPTKDYFSTNSSYTLKAFFPSDVKFKAGMEPNDIKEMAYPIISGKKYTAKLETALDRDYYKLNVEKEGTIYARLENLPYDYDLKLLDKHGNTIKSSLTGLNKPEALQFYAREKGTYLYLCISNKRQVFY
ncbi:hypothetical protein J6TS2_14790 [Heyndrickxia sporothermodurans]|nr:hypothetical protein J6TS2_14790 [Heyndrickxia sporothermodurans]